MGSIFFLDPKLKFTAGLKALAVLKEGGRGTAHKLRQAVLILQEHTRVRAQIYYFLICEANPPHTSTPSREIIYS